MGVGGEDFSASCGMQPDGDSLYLPKMQMLILARAAGILPLGNIFSIADYNDIDGLRNAAVRARRLGFMAVVCIHPAQVAVINEAYSPSTQEVEHARRVVEAASRAEAAGVGAYEVDGKMIDFPVVERARTILSRHESILALSRRSGG
jgi:citrate lyase subunit beta/citryl-CoA lyase